MFLRRAAIAPVPRFARVEAEAVANVERSLGEDDETLQRTLDRGFRELSRRHPALAEWLSDVVADRRDELAQSLGYFLTVTVFLSFQEAFPTRLREVDRTGVEIAEQSLELDRSLRAEDGSEPFDSDDVVAMGQPAVLEFVHHHIAQAIEQGGEELDVDDLDRIYRAVLVEVIALTRAVQAPPGQIQPLPA